MTFASAIDGLGLAVGEVATYSTNAFSGVATPRTTAALDDGVANGGDPYGTGGTATFGAEGDVNATTGTLGAGGTYGVGTVTNAYLADGATHTNQFSVPIICPVTGRALLTPNGHDGTVVGDAIKFDPSAGGTVFANAWQSGKLLRHNGSNALPSGSHFEAGGTQADPAKKILPTYDTNGYLRTLFGHNYGNLTIDTTGRYVTVSGIWANPINTDWSYPGSGWVFDFDASGNPLTESFYLASSGTRCGYMGSSTNGAKKVISNPETGTVWNSYTATASDLAWRQVTDPYNLGAGPAYGTTGAGTAVNLFLLDNATPVISGYMPAVAFTDPTDGEEAIFTIHTWSGTTEWSCCYGITTGSPTLVKGVFSGDPSTLWTTSTTFLGYIVRVAWDAVGKRILLSQGDGIIYYIDMSSQLTGASTPTIATLIGTGGIASVSGDSTGGPIVSGFNILSGIATTTGTYVAHVVKGVYYIQKIGAAAGSGDTAADGATMFQARSSQRYSVPTPRQKRRWGR